MDVRTHTPRSPMTTAQLADYFERFAADETGAAARAAADVAELDGDATLRRAAAILEREAHMVFESHTADGSWADGDSDVALEYHEMLAVAAALRTQCAAVPAVVAEASVLTPTATGHPFVVGDLVRPRTRNTCCIPAPKSTTPRSWCRSRRLRSLPRKATCAGKRRSKQTSCSASAKRLARSCTPIEALAAALHHAANVALSSVTYEEKDFAATHGWTMTERKAAIRGERPVPMTLVTRRPHHSDCRVAAMFVQTWGSTALGFGGLGGAAVTAAYTVVITGQDPHGEAAVYWAGRLAYVVPRTGFAALMADVADSRTASVAAAAAAYGAVPPARP